MRAVVALALLLLAPFALASAGSHTIAYVASSPQPTAVTVHGSTELGVAGASFMPTGTPSSVTVRDDSGDSVGFVVCEPVNTQCDPTSTPWATGCSGDGPLSLAGTNLPFAANQTVAVFILTADPSCGLVTAATTGSITLQWS